MASPGEIFERELPGLEREAPVGPRCAYQVGGPAEFLYVALRSEDLRHAVVVARELSVPVTVLGQATNVLVSDRNHPEKLDTLAGANVTDLSGKFNEVRDPRGMPV